MNRPLITLLLFLSLLLPSSLVGSSPSLIPQIERSLVRVEIGDLGGPHGICAGFVVSASKGEALTAAHCVPEDGEDFYTDSQPSTVVKQNALFALVKVEEMTKPPLPIREEEVKVMEEVWSFGFAWGDLMVFHRFVAKVKEGDLFTDGPIAPGMSGGPIVDGKGEVIGVNQASNGVVGVACGVKEIRKFLQP